MGYDQGSIHYNVTFLNEIIPGPLGILSSLYVCYGANIPVSYYFKILLKDPRNADQPETSSPSKELNLTNLFPIHILYTILILNNGLRSIIPCLVGLLIGKLYVYELLPGGSSWLLSNTVFRLFINPVKRAGVWLEAVRRRLSIRYERLSSGDSQEALEEEELNENNDEPDDNDEILDETRQQENQIRAETPVRPLGSQFLDTFRT